MGDTGLEQSALTPSKTAISQTSGAKSGALNDKSDHDLAEIVAIWPSLSRNIKEQMKALAQRQDKKHRTKTRTISER